MGDGCKDVGILGVGKEETSRVKLTEVNPHLVCVLCHGYFVDATTITECLHSFCRSCIFRHLETKSFCPICEVQVHARLHRSLKPDKTLQDIVYKLVPGLFHNEMERRRAFYKQHPYRDEHLEPERRGLGLDRLIYSPTDTISLSLEFYDTEREREEWSSVTCPHPQSQETSSSSTSNNNNKRYLQCPAIFKMAHLKKFLRQKYNLPRTANVEIIYKREFLPDSYSLMDVAYIYTWKRNGPMRFYYRIPDVVETEMPFEGKTIQDIQDSKTKSISKAAPPENPPVSSPKSDLERNKQVLSAANLPVETEEKKPTTPTLKQAVESSPLSLNVDSKISPSINSKSASKTVTKDSKLDKTDLKKDNQPLPNEKSAPVNKESDKNDRVVHSNTQPKNPPQGDIITPPIVPDKENSKEIQNKKQSGCAPLNSPKISKQDELPVEVLLSLSTCRVGKETAGPDIQKEVTSESEKSQTPKVNQTAKLRHSSNARMSLNKIANELQQKAANNFIQKTCKENPVSPSKSNPVSKGSPNSKTPLPNKINNIVNNLNGRINGNKRKNNGSMGAGRHFLNDMGVMDHRIQQLYKYQGSPVGNGVVQVGQKTESRLASWLNNRFQNKPPGSPSYPGITSPTLTLPNNALTNQLTVNVKLNGTKSSENLSSPGINIDLQNAINASIKHSNQSSIPPQTGLFNKSHVPINSHPLPIGKNSPTPNGKKQYSEKRDKNKMIVNSPNGILIKKDKEALSDTSPKSPIQTPQKNAVSSPVATKSLSPKVEDSTKNGKLLNNIINAPLAASYVKDQGLVIPEITPSNGAVKDKTSSSVSTTSNGKMGPPKLPSSKEGTSVNGEHSTSTQPVSTNGSEDAKKSCQPEPKQDELVTNNQDNKGDSSKLDEEVNRLKRKLEEMRKTSNAKGKELGGCQITHENPDPEEAKRRRDITPVVSIELMRGCKRPVPGLKAIQDIVDLGKRKGLEEKKDLPEKKIKLTTMKKEISKKEDTCALDLSRCGPPNPSTPPHPWFNPLLHQQFLPSPK